MPGAVRLELKHQYPARWIAPASRLNAWGCPSGIETAYCAKAQARVSVAKCLGLSVWN